MHSIPSHPLTRSAWHSLFFSWSTHCKQFCDTTHQCVLTPFTFLHPARNYLFHSLPSALLSHSLTQTYAPYISSFEIVSLVVYCNCKQKQLFESAEKLCFIYLVFHSLSLSLCFIFFQFHFYSFTGFVCWVSFVCLPKEHLSVALCIIERLSVRVIVLNSVCLLPLCSAFHSFSKFMFFNSQPNSRTFPVLNSWQNFAGKVIAMRGLF